MFRSFCLLSFFVASVSFADTANTQPTPVKRVISLAPHATELAYAAGLGDNLIAVSERSDYPKEALKLEKVANYQGIKLERIITLQPDLIIAWPAGNSVKELEKLEQFGFNIYYSQTQSLEDIATSIEVLSQYSHTPSIGETNAAKFRERLKQLSRPYNQDELVTFFYQLSEKPIITIAQGNWPGEVFRFCGGKNVFEDSIAPYPQVGIEHVLIANPDVIFTSEHAIENGNMWQNWSKQLTAIQNQHVWTLNSDWLNRPTVRTLKAIEQVCQYFDQVRQNR